MRRIINYTELLQLAGSFLHQQGGEYARLSLILCDNAVELLAHEQCQRRLLESASWMATPELSASDRADARGQEFAPKLNLLARLGDVQEWERDFANRAHWLRNECYHVATRHERVSWRVAWEYHELACGLFRRLRPRGIRIGPETYPSDAARELMSRAGLEHPLQKGWDEALDALHALLRSTKPPAPQRLSEVLSEQATSRIESILELVEFLAKDGFETYTHDEVIKIAYFHASHEKIALVQRIIHPSDQEFAAFHAAYDRAFRSYVPPLHIGQLERWLERAKALKGESSASSAIIKYTDLLRQSQEADTILREAARALDEAIQHEIDVRRGK